MSFSAPNTNKPNTKNTTTGRGRPLADPEAAARLGIKTRTMAAWRTRGQGPRYVKVGKSVRYFEADLEAFLEAGTVDPTADRG